LFFAVSFYTSFEECFPQFKMGFPYLEMEFSTRFPHYFHAISAYFREFRDFRDLTIGIPAFEIALFHFRNAKINIKVWKSRKKSAEIMRNIQFQNKEF
jgi:hypothetical protein